MENAPSITGDEGIIQIDHHTPACGLSELHVTAMWTRLDLPNCAPISVKLLGRGGGGGGRERGRA